MPWSVRWWAEPRSKITRCTAGSRCSRCAPAPAGGVSGSCLTLNAFGVFHDRGRVGVGLSVTYSEPNAAARLYQRLGMEFTPEVASWEKELRAGG